MQKILLVLILSVFAVSHSIASENNIIVQKIKGNFSDVDKSMRDAILGQGISLAHVLHASDMLKRTGKDFGYDQDVYANAEILEFCSARISQKLARIDPDNIILCPFTISLYTLIKEPDMVYIVYQIPVGKPGTKKVVAEVVALIQGIIEEATF